MKVERHKMTYKIDNKEFKNKLRILGRDFVKNNSNKGKVIINNKKYKIDEFITNENNKDNKIKIEIILNENIYNKSFMFKDCKSLLDFSNCDNYEFIDINIDNKYEILDNENFLDNEENKNYNFYDNSNISIKFYQEL